MTASHRRHLNITTVQTFIETQILCLLSKGGDAEDEDGENDGEGGEDEGEEESEERQQEEEEEKPRKPKEAELQEKGSKKGGE